MSKKKLTVRLKSKAKKVLLRTLEPYNIYQVSEKEKDDLRRIKENKGDFYLDLNNDISEENDIPDFSSDKAELEELKIWLGDTDKNHIWVFKSGNTGNEFVGNPKYLFAFINEYRSDIKAAWITNDEDTIAVIRKLGYKAYSDGSSSAGYLYNVAGVMADEQIRQKIPLSNNIKYLNMWHGWGFKPVERLRTDDDDDLRFNLCPKYIKHNTFYLNNQIVCVVNSLQEKYFAQQIGVDQDAFLRAGYARCIYQNKYKPISTFDHSIIKRDGLDSNTKIAVYAPTFRKNRGNTFSDAIPDLEKLYSYCKNNNILLIFKMHPLMENETAFVSAKETMGDRPYFLFWDNNNDFYEVMNKADLLIYDYSSIISDFVLAGVKNYIRYIFDGDDLAKATGMNSDEEYYSNTRGVICRSFDEMLEALSNYEGYDEEESLDDFVKRQWEYAGDDDLNKIIEFTLDYKIKDKEYPTLYSFDIFDTLISRKGLEPDSIFYAVRDALRDNNALNFNELFIERFPLRRKNAEFGIREYMNKSMEQRKTIKREITLSMIYEELQLLEDLTDEQRDYLMNLECEIEIDSVLPVSEEIDNLKSLLKEGEKVILISDMYLPVSVIRKMLEKADPIFNDIEIFLSNEYGTLKNNKFLFFEVYRNQKPFYGYGKWIHTGDNLNADQKQPRLLGIETRLVNKPEFTDIEKTIAEQIGCYDAYKLMAMQARMKNEYSFKSADFVIDYVAPLFVSYIDWVVRDAIDKGFQTLYFVSRDGHHLKRIADAIIKKSNLNLKTKYIYASRRVWRVPSYIDSVDDEFFANYGGNFNEIHDKEKFLKAACFDSKEEFSKVFPHIDLDSIDFDDWSDGQPAKKLAAILSTSNQYHEYLLDYAANQRKIVCDYLLQEVDPDEKHAFVEFFGRGYNQTCHSRLWDYALGKDVPVYYYYSRALLPTEGNCIRYKLTSTGIQFFFIEAIFANMPYKSIEEYTLKDGKIVPVKVPIQCDTDLYNAMELLLPEYADRYSGLELNDRKSFDKSLFDSLLYYYQDNRSDPFIYNNIGNLIDAVSVFGEKRPFARPYTEEDINNFRHGIPRTRGTMSVTMSYLKSDPVTKIKYDELYQIEPGDDCASGFCLKDSEIEKSREYVKLYKKVLRDSECFSLDYYQACKNTVVDNNQVLVIYSSKSLPDALKSIKSALLSNIELNLIEFSCSKLDDERKKQLAVLMAASAFIIVNGSISVLSGLELRENSKMIVIESSAFELIRKGYDSYARIKSMKKYNDSLHNLSVSAINASSDLAASESQKKYGVALDDSHIIKGSPVTDVYWSESFKSNAFEKVYTEFPEAENKKILLYMPNLRKMQDKYYYYNLIDIDCLSKLIGDEYVVIIDTRNHKELLNEVPNTLEIKGFSKVINSNLSLRELVVTADVIVGDFRDTLFESVLLNKPVFFSGYDYENRYRDVNFTLDYSKTAPFPIIKSSEELFERIKNINNYDYAPQNDFKNKYLTYCDGHSGEKVCEFIERFLQ